nr:dUTP diphosphatase [Roseibacterium persicicum]
MIEILREDWADPSVPLPEHATAGAAGADLRANLLPGDRALGLLLKPGGRVLVPTGLRVAVPAGYEMQIRARSGLAVQHGVALANGVGTIDSDYRGPLGVILVNLGSTAFRVRHGARIAQAVIAAVAAARFAPVEALDATARGAGGFGSTGRD